MVYPSARIRAGDRVVISVLKAPKPVSTSEEPEEPRLLFAQRGLMKPSLRHILRHIDLSPHRASSQHSAASQCPAISSQAARYLAKRPPLRSSPASSIPALSAGRVRGPPGVTQTAIGRSIAQQVHHLFDDTLCAIPASPPDRRQGIKTQTSIARLSFCVDADASALNRVRQYHPFGTRSPTPILDNLKRSMCPPVCQEDSMLNVQRSPGLKSRYACSLGEIPGLIIHANTLRRPTTAASTAGRPSRRRYRLGPGTPCGRRHLPNLSTSSCLPHCIFHSCISSTARAVFVQTTNTLPPSVRDEGKVNNSEPDDALG
ncbi:hypothetical protein C8F01DRAFT_1360528 [Mycena amicta]|nr:hypothetical protein C8F01DRAFT_1360528 [Mycena amicta]